MSQKKWKKFIATNEREVNRRYMKKTNKSLIKNMIFAFTAQGISLLMSTIMSLVVPKLLGVEEFSYCYFI